MLSYEPLWKTLISKKMKRTDLVENNIISPSTLAKLGKNQSVNSSTFDKICNFLNCNLHDVVEYIKE